jgi:hypothetical protein
MKLKNILYTAAAAATMMVGYSSCKKSAFDINKNPNSATDSTVSYDVILPAALTNTGSIMANNWGFLQNWMGYWARSGTYAPNVTEETYQITTAFGNGIWNGIYDNNYDYQIMQIKAKQAGATFYEGIARIMKAHNYQMLVDVYGNVPYFQALKGNANTTPAYDKGIDVYKDLFRQIDTAITSIRTASTNKDIVANDVMFAGNATLWVKFGNTIKLRMLVHLMGGGILSPQTTVSGIDIPGEFAKIALDGTGYLGAGENAQVNPGFKSDKPNPFYNNYKASTTGVQTANNVYYRANKWGIGYYAYNGDLRQARVYEASAATGMKGVEYGLPPITANNSANLAGIGPGLYKTNTAAQAILTSAESFFLQAEARQRGFITSGSTAATLLRSGIIESFTYLGVANAATAAAAYISGNAGYADVDIAAPALAAGLPAGGLFTIISQKWFALNGINTLEVWTDYRRVNLSATTPNFVYGQAVSYDPGPPISVSPQNSSTKIPVRLLYPQNEYNYNPANVGKEGTVNQFTSRIFWDLN